jgi:rubredoxin/mono/diheme cytochrome c family protein
MARYVCSICGYVHDDAQEDTPWSELADDWTCPICGAAKSLFDVEAKDGDSDGAPPDDTATSRAAGPNSRLLLGHRVFGFVFLAIYMVMMFQMVPRLWTYQIEFPARTAVHFSLGMALGVLLILKIAIVRFFPRLEQSLVPMLGTTILVSSVVLIGISVPAAFQEALATGKLFSPENRARVQRLLAQTGLEASECQRYASSKSLRDGQRVLRYECIDCHDLRTVLAKPRTLTNWRQTVSRMADRTTTLDPIGEDEQWQVTAYLIAISPQLQQSAQQLRDARDRRDEAKRAAQAAGVESAEPVDYDETAARQLFQAKCSQCHQTDLVTADPPASEQEARELVTRMVEEGLEATEEEIALIVRYITDFPTRETDS